MDRDEKNLFQACKIGDLAKIKQLVEKGDIELNVRDKWDSTPLYYACLCGHIDLVKYLLENGAKCEANTFDGERCRYGALTDQIRQLLRTSTVATTRLDQYELFLERLFELGSYSDIVFEINGRSLFKLHKSILATRSEYFRAKFEGVWRNRSWIEAKHEHLVPEAFESIVRYIYTDRFTTLKIHFDACLRLAKLFKLHNLLDGFNKNLYFLNRVIKKRSADSSSNDENSDENDEEEHEELKLSQFDVNAVKKSTADTNNPTPANIQLTINDTDIFLIGKFGANSKLSNTITIDSNEHYGLQKSEFGADMKQLALSCLPREVRDGDDAHELEKNARHDLTSIVDTTHDLCLRLENGYTFRVHKAFVAERCEYFRTFLHDPFNETKHIVTDDDNRGRKNTSKSVSELYLRQISPDVLTEIIFFLYSNDFSRRKLDESVLYEVLIVADFYLLPSLKRKCATELISYHLTSENLFDMFKLARVYDLKKLEFACIAFLAEHLDQFEESPQLRELIIEDAKKLKSRQETDTIDIVDDLRYAINDQMTAANVSSGGTPGERLIERELKLNLIDKILRELNLEC